MGQERYEKDMLGTVIEAMGMVRDGKWTFKARPKENPRRANDVVTNVDKEVEAFLAGRFQERFPEDGLIGEEGLHIPCPDPSRVRYWTLDPLDGTVPFNRRTPHGFSVMVAKVDGDEVVAACIGDVMTGMVYWFAPGQEPVTEDTVNGTRFLLKDAPRPMVRDAPLVFTTDPSSFERVAWWHGLRDSFGEWELIRGSLGLRFARQWMGETAGNMMRPQRDWTPWDDTPVIGFCRKLGFRYLALTGDGLALIEPPLVRKETPCEPAVLVIHESRLDDIRPLLA